MQECVPCKFKTRARLFEYGGAVSHPLIPVTLSKIILGNELARFDRAQLPEAAAKLLDELGSALYRNGEAATRDMYDERLVYIVYTLATKYELSYTTNEHETAGGENLWMITYEYLTMFHSHLQSKIPFLDNLIRAINLTMGVLFRPESVTGENAVELYNIGTPASWQEYLPQQVYSALFNKTQLLEPFTYSMNEHLTDEMFNKLILALQVA